MKVETSNTRNGWRTVKLESVVIEAVTGFACGQRDENGVIQLRMNNVSRRGELDLSNFIRVPRSHTDLETYVLRNGDVLFNNTNSTEMVGKTGLFEGYEEPVVFSNHFTRIRANQEMLYPGFLALWLHRQWLDRRFAKICDRWIGQSAVQRNKLLALEIPLPPLNEQRRIAARLREQIAASERARAAVENQRDAAQKLSAALLRAVFISPIAERWPAVLAGDVAEVVGGMQKTPDRAPRQFHKQFLTVRNVQRGFLDLSHVERFEVKPAEFERLRLQHGDLLIVEGNGSVDHIGRNALFNEDGEWIHQNHIIRVRLPGERFVPEFVSYYLNSDAGRAQMLQKAKTTTGLYTLSTKKVAALNFPAPSKTEQRTIATRLEFELSSARALDESLSMRLAEIERLPAALLRDAFIGTS